MTEENTDISLQEQMDRIVLKTAIDADFRQKFLSDPRAAYAAEGIEVPEAISINVVENSDTDLAVVLPPYVGDKLTVDELEVVSGGSMSDLANLAWGKVKEHGPGLAKKGIHWASGVIHDLTKD